MLTGTATNAPKKFPKSPNEIIGKSAPQKPLTANQWRAMIKFLAGGNREKSPRAAPPRDAPKDNNGN